MKLIKHFPLCPSEKCVGAGQHHLLGLALPTTLPEGSIFFGLFIGKPPYNCKQSLQSLCHSVGPSAGQNVESEQTPVLTFSTARNARSRCRFSPEERLFVAPVERNGNFAQVLLCLP